MDTETVVECGKWASIMSHVKNNRIEYLLLVGLMHLLGATEKAYSHVSGVCF